MPKSKLYPPDNILDYNFSARFKTMLERFCVRVKYKKVHGSMCEVQIIYYQVIIYTHLY